MSKSPKVPKYSLHKGTGQAVVRIKGRAIYLGPHGSPKSNAAYAQVIADFLTGREIRSPRSVMPDDPEPRKTITLEQLITRYQKFTPTYYAKHGKPTSEVASINCALNFLPMAIVAMSDCEFTLEDLTATRQRMIDAGLCRYSVNKYILRIKKMFSWAAGVGMIPPGISNDLKALTNLQPGRTTARETEPIRPIDDSIVEQTLPEMTTVVAAMVQLQRAAGMRPDEVCMLRPCDLDRSSAEYWVFNPMRHKTEHHNKTRRVYIGSLGQDILRPYLLRPEEEYCFRPDRASATPRALRRDLPPGKVPVFRLVLGKHVWRVPLQAFCT